MMLEKEWRNILFEGKDGVCVTDEQGVILYLNDAAASLAASGGGLVGVDETDVFGGPSAAEICAGQGGARTFPKETPDGRGLTAAAYPLSDENGAVTGLVLFLRERNDGDGVDDDETLLLTYRGTSMSHVITLATKLARIDSTVLISGESGTGKVMLAQYMHRNSNRREGAFASLNCAAMPGEMLEEELFGSVGGDSEKTGLLSRAAGGTLFLDEINALPLFLQTRLLYTLHEKKYHPVGGRGALPVDCRLIAATDRDLHRMVAAGEFREDLFYMIDVFEISLPPIRERARDVLPLLEYLAERYNRRYGLHRQLSAEALSVLAKYSWPGNLREMNNTMERLIVMAPEDVIESFHLPDPIRFQAIADPGAGVGGGSLDDAVEEVERSVIRRAYDEYGSSYEVARVLKISQSRASRLIRKYCPARRKRGPAPKKKS
ncbi:MAG: sigma 54-interacting transcriptional regulator [Bacillota bacterium]|jgi:transcriptional regulator with PAS, ATPase and Fis domain